MNTIRDETAEEWGSSSAAAQKPGDRVRHFGRSGKLDHTNADDRGKLGGGGDGANVDKVVITDSAVKRGLDCGRQVLRVSQMR